MTAPTPVDPDQTLAALREAAADVRFEERPGPRYLAAARLAELLDRLDLWLAAGGRLPQPWSVAPAAEDPVVTDPDPVVAQAAQELRDAIAAATTARTAQRTATTDLAAAARTLAAARRRYEELRRT